MRIMTYTNARNNLRQLIDEVVDSSTETVITSDSIILISKGAPGI